MALMVEAAELAEIFQWLDAAESGDLSEERRAKVRAEIGDVLIYLTRLADVLGIDPVKSARHKLEVNAAKYPADKVRGKSLKYDEYPE